MVLGVLTGWLDRQEREAVAYLIEEHGSCGASLTASGPESTGPYQPYERCHGLGACRRGAIVSSHAESTSPQLDVSAAGLLVPAG
jgi:hypothetical protein